MGSNKLCRLIDAAIIWFRHNLVVDSKVACALAVLAVVTALVAVCILIWFQFDLYKLRQRIVSANNYCFVGKEKDGLGIKSIDDNPFGRGGHILAALILVCVGGVALVLFALN